MHDFFKSLKPQRDQNLIQLKQTLTLEKKGPKGQKEGQDREWTNHFQVHHPLTIF